ncbi:hypothetical protein QTP86_006710 [Hemibagrus guttatus]|nr:hypothetical protein QTP86_006710 [Hemibagrus guttatus]
MEAPHWGNGKGNHLHECPPRQVVCRMSSAESPGFLLVDCSTWSGTGTSWECCWVFRMQFRGGLAGVFWIIVLLQNPSSWRPDYSCSGSQSKRTRRGTYAMSQSDGQSLMGSDWAEQVQPLLFC